MINADDLKKVCKLILLSGYLKNEKPLGALFISGAGNGKTEIISYHKSKRISFFTDLSYRGLLDCIKDNPQTTHIVIPDYLKITMKRRSTSDNLTSLLNAITEEGVGKIQMYNFSHDYEGKTLGLITATTRKSFSKQKSQWEAMGFTSRLIILSFDYKDETIDKIMDYINDESYKFEKRFEKLTGFRDVEIVSDKKFNKQMNKLANKSFRRLKQLQTLLKCNALLNNRKEVNQEDVEEIKRLSKYLNLKFFKI